MANEEYEVPAITSLITHVNDNKSAAIKQVKHAFSMSPFDVDDYDTETPAAFFYLRHQDSSDPQRTERPQITSLIYVDMLCTYQDLPAITGEVRALTIGFNFGPRFTNVAMAFPERSGGETGAILEIRGDYIWWQDRYEVSCHLPCPT